MGSAGLSLSPGLLSLPRQAIEDFALQWGDLVLAAERDGVQRGALVTTTQLIDRFLRPALPDNVALRFAHTCVEGCACSKFGCCGMCGELITSRCDGGFTFCRQYRTSSTVIGACGSGNLQIELVQNNGKTGANAAADLKLEVFLIRNVAEGEIEDALANPESYQVQNGLCQDGKKVTSATCHINQGGFASLSGVKLNKASTASRISGTKVSAAEGYRLVVRPVPGQHGCGSHAKPAVSPPFKVKGSKRSLDLKDKGMRLYHSERATLLVNVSAECVDRLKAQFGQEVDVTTVGGMRSVIQMCPSDNTVQRERLVNCVGGDPGAKQRLKDIEDQVALSVPDERSLYVWFGSDDGAGLVFTRSCTLTAADDDWQPRNGALNTASPVGQLIRHGLGAALPWGLSVFGPTTSPPAHILAQARRDWHTPGHPHWTRFMGQTGAELNVRCIRFWEPGYVAVAERVAGQHGPQLLHLQVCAAGSPRSTMAALPPTGGGHSMQPLVSTFSRASPFCTPHLQDQGTAHACSASVDTSDGSPTHGDYGDTSRHPAAYPGSGEHRLQSLLELMTAPSDALPVGTTRFFSNSLGALATYVMDHFGTGATGCEDRAANGPPNAEELAAAIRSYAHKGEGDINAALDDCLEFARSQEFLAGDFSGTWDARVREFLDTVHVPAGAAPTAHLDHGCATALPAIPQLHIDVRVDKNDTTEGGAAKRRRIS